MVTYHEAACVNILPGITSVYAWQGQIESAQEHLLLIKAHKDHYQSIETTLRNHHPYELPEIIAVSIDRGLPGYLKWIDSCHSLK
ncbi:MAG TPA: divalent-cation tolerance protein CutA [Methylobacter sp.]